jgi:exosortase
MENISSAKAAAPCTCADEPLSKWKPWRERLTSGWALAGFAVISFWLLFFNQIRGEWEINPQYGYGYAVPLLGGVLFWRRWQDRPSPDSGKSPWVLAVAFGLLLIVFPLGVLFEANPEWRLLYWMSGLQALGLSLCALNWIGGNRWVRYFAPPIAFMLIALPWPVEMEKTAIQGLMRLVAGLTVDIVNLLGIPAIQHGNLIEVGAGLVGIDEACSGVRSLQSSLMLSLFLGEINRWSWKRRLVLLGASMLFVLFANLARTTFLVWAAANRGIHQMEAWHDTAGNLVMFIVLPSLIGLSLLMKPKEPAVQAGSHNHAELRPIPHWVGIAMFLWLLVSEIGTEMWYRVHEKRLVANVNWSVVWPEEAMHFRKTELPENSRIILRCSRSEAATWQDGEGNDLSAFVLRWDPGRNSAQLAKGHRPDICFPAAGAKLVNDFGRIAIPANGFDLPFHYQTFASGDKLLHVFYCLWSDRVSANKSAADDSSLRASRVRAALDGERNLGQKVIEIVISGPETRDEAVDLMQSELQQLVQKIN